MEEARAVDVQRGEGTDQSTMVQSVLLSAASAVFGLLNGRGPWRSKIYAARRTIGMKEQTWGRRRRSLSGPAGRNPLPPFFGAAFHVLGGEGWRRWGARTCVCVCVCV